jgi:hypothetical protein
MMAPLRVELGASVKPESGFPPVMRTGACGLSANPGTKRPAACSSPSDPSRGTESDMRKAFILATGLVLVATSAWSQGSSRDRDDFGYGGWRESRDSWDHDNDRRRGPRMRDDDPEDQDGRPGGGARFFVRSGDTQLRVVCGDRESTQACVDSALRMFDRVQSQQGTASRSSTAPTPGTPPQ